MVTRCTSWAYVAAVLLLTGVSTATAKYSGGTGEPNDPYQIATAADLIALGETPEDYDKHFILTADIDLSTFDGKDSRPFFHLIGDCGRRTAEHGPETADSRYGPAIADGGFSLSLENSVATTEISR